MLGSRPLPHGFFPWGRGPMEGRNPKETQHLLCGGDVAEVRFPWQSLLGGPTHEPSQFAASLTGKARSQG